MDLKFALHIIGAEPARYGLPLSVCHDRQGMGTVGKDAARSLIRKQKDHGRSGNRLVVLILHLDDWLTGRALLYIVDGAVAFHNDDIELAGGFLSPR